MRNSFQLLLIFGVFIFSMGCKEDPSFLGRNILPSGDDLKVKIDTSIVIDAYTITGRKVVTSLNNYFPVGSLKDSIFGYSTAGLIAQYQPAYLNTPGVINSIDSAMITLTIKKAYGDSITTQTIRIYELTEILDLDTFYYSDFDISDKYNLTEMGSTTFSPQDSFIRIKITNESYFNRFFIQPDSIYQDLEDFTRIFKGFYFKVDNVTGGGGYSLLDLDADSSHIDLYYNGSSDYVMFFSSNVIRFNVYTHDYESYPINDHLNLPGSNDSVLFIEGLSGVSVKLKFPFIDTFLVNKKVAINRASLIIPVDQTSNISENNYPEQLMLFKLLENDDYEYLYDYKINSSYFDGKYNKSEKAYVINIGLHLQNYLNRKIENSELVIVSYTSNETPNRVIIKGAVGVKPKIMLKVTYTEI